VIAAATPLHQGGDHRGAPRRRAAGRDRVRAQAIFDADRPSSDETEAACKQVKAAIT